MTEQASLLGALRRSDSASAPNGASRGDELEAGLNALIERRAANAEHADDPQAREEIWKESARQYYAEYREANRHAWIGYFKRAAANHRGLAERMEARAEEVSRIEV